MMADERRVRVWLAVAGFFAELAAAGAGLFSEATLVLVGAATSASTWFVVKPSARTIRVSYALAVAVAMNALRQLPAQPAAVTSAGVSASLSTLTLTLILLTLVLAPGWRQPRDYRLWLAMTAAVAVAACATGTGPAKAVVLVATWLALLCAAGAIASWSLGTTADVVAREESPPPTLRPGGVLSLTSVVLPVALGVLIFTVLPGGLGGGDLPGKVARYVNPPATFTATRGLVGIDTTGNGNLDLRVRGALPTTPLLLVPANAPPLWRGTVYRDYSGKDWRAAAPDVDTAHRIVRGNDVTLLTTKEDPLPVGMTRTDVVRLEPGTPSLLAWAPGVVTRVQGAMFGAGRNAGAVRLFRSRGAVGYTVTSVVAETAPASLLRTSGSDVVDASWTSLPAELPRRVIDLARQVTAGRSTRYEQVQAIAAYLRTHETYSLDSPVPGPHDDAVDQFLFRDHVGFCEQFASAEAVLLRALGVPARVVSGLAYGHRQQDGVLFTAADAHAWVEVYYPGVGWSPIDPTAGARLAADTGRHDGLLASLRRALPNAAGPAGGGALVLVAIGGLVFARRRQLLQRSAPTPLVLRAFLRLVRRSGRPRHSAETAREYLARHPEGATLAEALAVLEAECYGVRGPDPKDAEHAAQLFADAARL